MDQVPDRCWLGRARPGARRAGRAGAPVGAPAYRRPEAVRAARAGTFCRAARTSGAAGLPAAASGSAASGAAAARSAAFCRAVRGTAASGTARVSAAGAAAARVPAAGAPARSAVVPYPAGRVPATGAGTSGRAASGPAATHSAAARPRPDGAVADGPARVRAVRPPRFRRRGWVRHRAVRRSSSASSAAPCSGSGRLAGQ